MVGYERRIVSLDRPIMIGIDDPGGHFNAGKIVLRSNVAAFPTFW
jgi:hypothetical protein